MIQMFRAITTERAEIVLQMDSLKLQLLDGSDVTQTQKKLRDMQLELEVADVALTEIRGQLTQIMADEIQRDYDQAPRSGQITKKRLTPFQRRQARNSARRLEFYRQSENPQQPGS